MTAPANQAILQAVFTSQAAVPGWAEREAVTSAYTILLRTSPIPENLIAAADLIRQEAREHLDACGCVDPQLNAVLCAVVDHLKTHGWAFEDNEWRFYRRTDTPLPSMRSGLQEVER